MATKQNKTESQNRKRGIVHPKMERLYDLNDFLPWTKKGDILKNALVLFSIQLKSMLFGFIIWTNQYFNAICSKSTSQLLVYIFRKYKVYYQSALYMKLDI